MKQRKKLRIATNDSIENRLFITHMGFAIGEAFFFQNSYSKLYKDEDCPTTYLLFTHTDLLCDFSIGRSCTTARYSARQKTAINQINQKDSLHPALPRIRSQRKRISISASSSPNLIKSEKSFKFPLFLRIQLLRRKEYG